MILRSIRVEGWRCFVAPVEVGPFIDGLNIIYGPNGIGKSTLMTALTRGLFDSHNVGGTDIKSLRPWGRSLAPKVTIAFEQNGEQFQLHKQFLSSQSARLDRKEGDRYVPFAESRAADDKAREILSGDAPGRGASDHRHWGLAQILWASQGSLRIEQLASGTRATIQDALGAQIAGPGTEALEERIATAYGQFYTAKGKLKSGALAPAIVGLQSQLENARARRMTLQQRLDEFDNASRRIEDFRCKTESARHSEQELNQRLKESRPQVQAYQVFISQQKLHQQEVAAAEENYRNLSDRIKSICAADEEHIAATQALKRLRDDWPAQAKLVTQCQDDATLAGQSVQEVRSRRNEVAAKRQRAKVAERYARTRQDLCRLDKQIKQIELAQGEIRELRQSRDRIVAPDKKTLTKVAKVARERDDARLRLDAALITVRIEPETERQVEITRAEETGTKPLESAAAREIKGAPDVAFRIPGVGKFLATGPTGDFGELHRQWESAVASFEELTAGFGTSDMAALERLCAAAEALDNQISRGQVRVHTMLRGESLDQLRSSRSRATNTLDEILSQRPEWSDDPPDPAEILRQADETEKQFTADIDRTEAAHDRAQATLRLALQKQSGHQAEIAGLEAQVAAVEKRLESLRNDGVDDKQRKKNLTQIAMRRDAAQGKLAVVDEQIRQVGDDPSKSLVVLERQLEGLRAEAADADKKLNTESGRLEQIIAEAPYSALADVEDEISRLEGEIYRQRLQIDAIRVLYETLVDQKREVMQSILDPIRLRANNILQRIAGTRFENIHFDETLLPSGISPKSVDDAVALDNISGGEREQVHFAVRMALADVAFNDDRQLVVLDDVFTFTDTTRLARIATILDQASARFQIVLLTCHPERYRGLPKAKFFDLETIVAGQHC